MKVKCPSCGASLSLDVLIAHDEARTALVALSGISDELVRGCLKYLTLFRPSEKDLTFARVAKLVGEIAPMIRAAEISRNRRIYPAPREAWIWAFNRCLEARDAGKLKPPLTSHGYLLENITFWSPEKTAGMEVAVSGTTVQTIGQSSKLRQGVNALNQWAGGDWIKQELAAGLSVLATLNMNGRPAATDLPAIAELWYQQIIGRDEQYVEAFDRVRFQTAFKVFLASKEWPNASDLIRSLPMRLVPRTMIDAPKQDVASQRDKLQAVKNKINPKGVIND
ncbi:MAG: hypothetical protein Q4C79_00765 [Neisseria sp.]|uniref:hypothetical protein n=1 Tax=Neisseria sp. TaxID=192066 RepID=UPI0026DC79D5|nr:hypothetical protein [Neisseria sp.]MDO4247490.1 hypothetical protein [Neisseria sp.]